MEFIETRYARTDDGVHLAYNVLEGGPIDLMYFHGFLGNLEVLWEFEGIRSLMRKLSTIARVIRHDPRATGLSDHASSLPDLETMVDDARTVLDAAGSYSTVLFGAGGLGWNTAAMFASLMPERVRALCLWGGGARAAQAPDYPWGATPEQIAREERRVTEAWGSESYAASVIAEEAPSLVADRDVIRWYAKVQRHWATPASALELTRRYYATDMREVLQTIRVPTLVLTREWPDQEQDEHGRALIPDATLVRIAGIDGATFAGDPDGIVEALRGFLGVDHETSSAATVMRTILFTDIVSSTETAARVGDRAWKDLLERHHVAIRAVLERFDGVEVDTVGDGFMATFEGPARAIRCARAILEAVSPLGIEVRAGLHAGECEIVDGKVAGIAVSIGSRIGSMAAPSEVLVSQTVKDLVAGSGLDLRDRGLHELKGVPGEWRLYAATDVPVG